MSQLLQTPQSNSKRFEQIPEHVLDSIMHYIRHNPACIDIHVEENVSMLLSYLRVRVNSFQLVFSEQAEAGFLRAKYERAMMDPASSSEYLRKLTERMHRAESESNHISVPVKMSYKALMEKLQTEFKDDATGG